MFVAVINKNGKPLMPTTPRNARLLLKSGKARIVRREPFTIQLNYGSSGYIQEITVGVDTGSKHLAVSLTTQQKEIYATQLELRTDIVDLLSDRRALRRARRNRKTRHRKARFSNRKKSEGWLTPSVRHKVDASIKLLDNIRRYFPVTQWNIEVAPFDIQKINNPDISGVEYQHGAQLGFTNVREYVLYRDGHKCRVCGKSGKLHVHHIESRKTGGNTPNNLVTLCADCHLQHHDNTKPLKLKRGKVFKDAIQVTIISKRICDWLENNGLTYAKTYGYITKCNRNQLELDKSHLNDAFVIAGNLSAKRIDSYILQKRVRANNRQLHKLTINKGGTRKANKCPKEIFGYRLFDKVRCLGKIGFIFGRRSSGGFDIRTLSGEKISANINYKKLELIQKSSTTLTEERRCSS